MTHDPDLDIALFGYDRDIARRTPRWLEALRRAPLATVGALGWRLSGKRQRASNVIASITGERLRDRSAIATPHLAATQGRWSRRAFVALDRNRPAASLNSELAVRQDDFFILHWPQATPLADFEDVVRQAFATPHLAAIYVDELIATLSPLVPLVKPPLDEDMLLAEDYIGSHLAIRREVFAALGGLPDNCPGSELHHLALSVAAKFGRHAIGHLPVFALRQEPKTSTSPPRDRREARRRNSQQYLNIKGVAADCILDQASGIVHVHRKLPARPPRVSVIVPTRDRLDLLQPCLDSIFQLTDYRDYDVTVVDQASIEPETASYLKRLSSLGRISLLRIEGQFNFSQLNNAAARQAAGEVLVFLNNDTQVINADWLKELVVHAIRPEVGAVGAKLLYPDGRIQHGGISLGGPLMARHAYRYFPGDHAGYLHRLLVPHRVDAVTAACMAITAEKFHAVGGFDEIAFPVAYNDVDLCLKLERAGYFNLWTPYATLTHKEQATRGDWRDKGEAEAFGRKWAARMAAAPVNPIDA